MALMINKTQTWEAMNTEQMQKGKGHHTLQNPHVGIVGSMPLKITGCWPTAHMVKEKRRAETVHMEIEETERS